jgi:hypothetical protein
MLSVCLSESRHCGVVERLDGHPDPHPEPLVPHAACVENAMHGLLDRAHVLDLH